MRSWLFYKLIPRDGYPDTTIVQFRRVDDGILSSFLPPEMSGDVILPSKDVTPDGINAYARRCNWVGEPARAFDSPLGLTLLGNKWDAQR